MCSIAIIPARGGSKRIPKKNILDFNGKPMIAWTIEAALQTGDFSRVLVSTDDEEIAEVAAKYGAEVPFLRKTAADDISPVSVATIAALEQAEEYWGETYDLVVQLMANCPLRTSATISSMIHYFNEHQIDFLISAFKFGWMNPWWASKLNENSEPEQLFKNALNSRSQDLPDLYCPTGAVWMAKSDSLKSAGSFYGPAYRFGRISWEDAVDIDDYEDLVFAKAVFKMRSE